MAVCTYIIFLCMGAWTDAPVTDQEMYWKYVVIGKIEKRILYVNLEKSLNGYIMLFFLFYLWI